MDTAAPAPGATPAVTLPRRAGIGLRHPHVPAFLSGERPDVAWVEVHSETYLVAGGPRLAALETIRRDYALSCHGVGLSLGSAAGLDANHLANLRQLYDRLQPDQISDHLAWTGTGGAYLNDLLPLPLTAETRDVVAINIAHAQDVLGRRLLVENPSLYMPLILPPGVETIPEPQFLADLVARTGCGLLLDVNNVVVCAHNLGFDAAAYLADFPLEAVGEIHVAGHRREAFAPWVGPDAGAGGVVLIDDHGSRVSDTVWDLLAGVLSRTGPLPVLVEWDMDVPPLEVLLGEAAHAQSLLDGVAAHA
ncbi:DUF692 domain-containing protein [Nitrospirillum amazonense]|uniref:Uncharacterized protein n=1 Tax=Nitrospirillum amazonense TaxID=28077 RepID=A0A560JIQ1_9PROT|nr:DUF692 domain-containing protein [Nitrospirillum amazonense]MDG3439840.1 DUF692 domain-containing protein [Nitrospirillum amazonense]TWB70886.1 hypothetical protein FBZ87_107270 [Nitrospirillum amazonense]